MLNNQNAFLLIELYNIKGYYKISSMTEANYLYLYIELH